MTCDPGKSIGQAVVVEEETTRGEDKAIGGIHVS